MDIGPVELIVLTFPGKRTDARVVDALSEVISNGDVTVLDVVCLTRLADGTIETTDVENLGDIGLDGLDLEAHALIAEDDLAFVLEIVSVNDPCTAPHVPPVEHILHVYGTS